MNNGQQLLNIAEAGLILSSDNRPEYENNLLIVLLDIEDALDKGRSLIFDSKEINAEINTKMDKLRKRIRDLLDAVDKDTAKRILEERGESLKRQFSIS